MKFNMTIAAFLLACPSAVAYCNSMGGMGYGPRTSKAYPPGWNGLVRTPARGWRSWYAYYTHMNQHMIEDAIDALAAKNRTVKGWEGKVSLCDLGYCSAGIDEGWEGCGKGVNGTQHFINGTPAANPVTFPDIKGLVDYGHSKGVKMGWYFNGCGCIEKREPASGWDINYEGDIAQLHQFGFDSVSAEGTVACGYT
jgi:alpha-galactosidase